MSFLKKFLPLSLAIAFLSSGLSAQERLSLPAGTFGIGGSLKVINTIDDLTDAANNYYLTAVSDAGIKYFVIDNLSLGVALNASGQFVVPDKVKESGFAVGLKLSTAYHFDFGGAVIPYLGLNVSPALGKVFGGEEGVKFNLKAGLDAGILVGLNSSVALDIGLAPEVGFPVTEGAKWTLNIPAGYLGVAAFF